MHYMRATTGNHKSFPVPDASDVITNCGYIMALRHGVVMPYEKGFRIHYANHSRDFASTDELYGVIDQHLREDCEKGCNFGELIDAMNRVPYLDFKGTPVLFRLQEVLAPEIILLTNVLGLAETLDQALLSKILFCIEQLPEIVGPIGSNDLMTTIDSLNRLKMQLSRFQENLEIGARAYKGYEQFDFDYTKYVDFDKYLEVIEHILTRIDRLMKFNSTIRTSHFVGQAVSKEVHKFTQAVNDSLSSFGDIAELSIEPINEDVVMRFIMNNIHLASRDDCDKYTPVNNPTNNFQ